MAARKTASEHEQMSQIVLLLAQIREMQMAMLMAMCYEPDQTDEMNMGRVAQYLGMARRAYSDADATTV